MSDDNPPDLEVIVEEEVDIGESLARWKAWFNGPKHFFTVKVLPKDK